MDRDAALTHGRHCSCSACAREDWTKITAPCGMHGPSCPAIYAPDAASGLHSHVTVNLKAREAVALGKYLRGTEHWTCDPDAMAALAKLKAAADRATVPWEERDHVLPF